MTEEMNQNATPAISSEDIEKNKLMAFLAYIIFFIPLIAAKDSKFARYHANQGLVLLISAIALQIIIGFFSFPFIGIVMQLVANILIFVLWIMGILNAFGGKVKPLPIIGGINIIK